MYLPLKPWISKDNLLATRLAALQGRVPGMVITQNTGVAGGAWKVQIRGRNSIRSSYNANEPLYVVDGVPYPSALTNGMSSARYDITLGGSPLNFVNPAGHRVY